MSSKQFKQIETQCTWWDMYGRIMPTACAILVAVLFLLDQGLYKSMIITGITLFAVTMAVWWYWAVRSIGILAQSNWIMHGHTEEIVRELQHARKDLQEIRRDLAPVSQASDA